MLADIKSININLDGIFINGDAGFDCLELKQIFESEEMIHNIEKIKEEAKKKLRINMVLIISYIKKGL